MASETTLFEDANKDFLTCSICKDIFKNPKQLKCMHNFCQDCLQPLVTEGTPCKIKCPLCREEVELELDSVAELEDNFFLSNLCDIFLVAHLNTVDVLCSFCSEALNEGNASRCIECSENLCEICAKAHTLTCFTRNHQVILMSELETETLVRKARERNIKVLCQKHQNNQLDYFCQTCQVPVCLGCTVVDHVRQSGHNLLNLQDGPTKENFKEQITEQVHKLEEIMPSFEKNIAIANYTEKCLIESLEKTKNDIRETAKSLIDEIEAHSKALIEKVDKRAEAIQKVVENHREAAEIRLKSSTGINQFARNVCKHGLNAEIMSSAKDLLRRMKELQEELKDIEEAGELRFVGQKEFKFGVVEEYKIKVRDEYNLLEYYTKKEMAEGNYVRRGPNWPTGYDQYDNYGRKFNTIQSIQRNGPNDVDAKVRWSYSHSPIVCKMNPGKYWLQPANPSQNYMGRLECYAKNIMKVGDEVKMGLNWPIDGRYDSYDNRGQKLGKITQINQNQGKTDVIVDFGPPDNKTLICPMYAGNYYLLPLRPFPLVSWVEF